MADQNTTTVTRDEAAPLAETPASAAVQAPARRKPARRPAAKAAAPVPAGGEAVGAPVEAPAVAETPEKGDTPAQAAAVSPAGKPAKAGKGAKAGKERSEKGGKPEKAPEKAEKPRKPRLVRDSYTIPQNEHQRLDAMKARALAYGVGIKKSELLRAGLLALDALDDIGFRAAIERVEVIKTGRPRKGD